MFSHNRQIYQYMRQYSEIVIINTCWTQRILLCVLYSMFIWIVGILKKPIGFYAKLQRESIWRINSLYLEENIIGHIPSFSSQNVNFFFLYRRAKDPQCVVTSKRINPCVDNWVEVPVKYFLSGVRAVSWVGNHINASDKCMIANMF